MSRMTRVEADPATGRTERDLRGALRAARALSSAEFYGTADLVTAKRIGGIMWLIGWLIVVVLLPFAPPTQHLGNAGWVLVAGILLATLWLAGRLLRTPERVTPNELLLSSYLALAYLMLLVWLGGGDAPYEELYVLGVIYTCAVHPPRRLLPYLGAVMLAALAPIAYADPGSSEIAEIVTKVVLWVALGGVAALFVSIVRVRRLGLVAGERAARTQARLDPLTGLGNRRAFDETLARAVAGARRADRQFSIVIVDLARFKSINDRFGHLEGDRCLRAVARALRATVRAPDACFRWGGDEFALVLPATDRLDAERVADRVRSAVEGSVVLPDGEALQARCGSAEFEEGMDAVALLNAADVALIAPTGDGSDVGAASAEPGT
jgi:diguanylate cyclase (GGDEF)-like protein